jgi:hypothetical protein
MAQRGKVYLKTRGVSSALLSAVPQQTFVFTLLIAAGPAAGGGLVKALNHIIMSFHSLPRRHFMAIEGYVDYKRREYCKDIKCPVQMEMDTKKEDSEDYQNLRKKCQVACLHTTYEFHQWLIKQGYEIVKRK